MIAAHAEVLADFAGGFCCAQPGSFDDVEFRLSWKGDDSFRVGDFSRCFGGEKRGRHFLELASWRNLGACLMCPHKFHASSRLARVV